MSDRAPPLFRNLVLLLLLLLVVVLLLLPPFFSFSSFYGGGHLAERDAISEYSQLGSLIGPRNECVVSLSVGGRA